MTGADLDRARVGVLGIRVMQVDESLARTDGRPKQILDLAAFSRQLAEAPLVVSLALHVT